MRRKDFDIVTFEGFVAEYMGTDARFLLRQSGALQLYPLSIASSLIKTPTPLFRATYNFLLLFSDGGGQQQVDNETINLNANDVLFIREGHLNAIKFIDSGTNGYFIYIDNALLSQVFVDRTLLNHLTFHPKYAVSKSDMEWLCQCCELLFRQDTDEPYAEEIRHSLLKAIVLKLAEASPALSSRPERQSEIAMRFKELLYGNFLHKRNVKFYAESLAVSENYLNRCVKHLTSKSPKQHINEMLINHSKILLQDQSKDIAQIAFELNFSDPSYFGKLFKQLTRLTPSGYRNMNLQDLSGSPHDFS